MASTSDHAHVQVLHEPLTVPRTIRLIALHPGERLESVHISLDVVSVDNPEPYEALSYAWDNQTPSVSIICGPQQLFVTQNAFDAMCELRLPNDDRYLWIDQICINQQDPTERANQVALMADIYSKARNAIVWLGKADESTALAFELINKLTFLYRCGPKTHEIFYVASVKDVKEAAAFHCSDSSEEIRSAVSALPPADSDEFRSVIALLRRSWFGRLWVFQEVVLGTEMTQVRCGSLSCLIQDFYDAIRAFDNCGYDDLLTYGDGSWLGDSIVNTFGTLRFRRQRRIGKITLDVLLSCTTLLKCHNPLDRVYAILGVADPRYLSHIPIDYGSSVFGLFGAVVRASLAVDCSLTVLGHVQRFEYPENDLPSWTPNWRDPRTAYGVTLGFRSNDGTRSYNACNNRPVELLPTTNSRHLALRGVRFRQIIRFANERISIRMSRSPRHELKYEYHSWCEMYQAEAIRLEIPRSCFRTNGYAIGAGDDILGHQMPLSGSDTSHSSDERLLSAVALRRALTADLYPRPHGKRGGRWHNMFPRCHDWARRGRSTAPTPEMLQEHDSFVDRATRSRMLYLAGNEPDDAYLCLASVDVKAGDWICVLFGGDVPFVLRERPPSEVRGDDEAVEIENRWEFICECFVDGIMDGEFLQEFRSPVEETFVLD